MASVPTAVPFKTFTTEAGFYELAVAAPSMKAALAAWGMKHNAFQQGFARQAHDPAIVAAAIAHPGVVLRRPLGTSGPFKLEPDLPRAPKSRKPAKTSNKKQVARNKHAKEALEEATTQHESLMQQLAAEQSALKARIGEEKAKWRAAGKSLRAAIKAAPRAG